MSGSNEKQISLVFITEILFTFSELSKAYEIFLQLVVKI